MTKILNSVLCPCKIIRCNLKTTLPSSKPPFEGMRVVSILRYKGRIEVNTGVEYSIEWWKLKIIIIIIKFIQLTRYILHKISYIKMGII